MSEKIPSGIPSHEFAYSSDGWKDVKATWDKASNEANHFDQVWTYFGGDAIDSLQAEIPGADAATRFELEKKLEDAKWRFYDTEMRGLHKASNVGQKRKDRDTRIELYATERDRRRQVADSAYDAWDAIGGSEVDEAEMKLASIKKSDAKKYKQAKAQVRDARGRVASRWQALHQQDETSGGTQALPDDDDRQDYTEYVPNWNYGEPEENNVLENSDLNPEDFVNSTQGESWSDGKSSSSTTAEQSSSESHESIRSDTETAGASQPEKAKLKPLSEGALWFVLQESLRRYEVNEGIDPWGRMQEDIWRYEAAQSERRMREVNESLDAAHQAATEASGVQAQGEDVQTSPPTTETNPPVDPISTEAKTDTIQDESEDVRPKKKGLAKKVAARIKYFFKRRKLIARAKNIKRIQLRRETAAATLEDSAEIDQPATDTQVSPVPSADNKASTKPLTVVESTPTRQNERTGLGELFESLFGQNGSVTKWSTERWEARTAPKDAEKQGPLGDLVRKERLGYVPHGSDRSNTDTEQANSDTKAA